MPTRSMLVSSRAPRALRLLALACATLAGPALSPVIAQGQIADAGAPLAARAITARPMDESQWSSEIWKAARSGDTKKFESLLATIASGDVVGEPDSPLKRSSSTLSTHLREREETRAKKINESREELAKLAQEDQTPHIVSKELGEVIELQLLVPDRDELMREADIAALVKRADALARHLESEGQSIEAIDLFLRLNALHDISGTYKPDIKRLAQRQEMLRLYAPRRLYEMNNAFRVSRGDKPLPPFNSLGSDYRSKLSAIRADMVEQSLARARDHVEGVPMNTMALGGIAALRTLATTTELHEVFPALDDKLAREGLVETLDREAAALAALPVQLDAFQVSSLLERLMRRNDQTLKLPAAVVLHEFGNGAMGVLDDYSSIIWPDEVRRFRKTTEGRFVGVGVQIELNEQREVRIVTPLEGTPAQRAGLHPGDILTKVSGKSVFGLGLDEVVDVITGPAGSSVTLTIERPQRAGAEDNAGETKEQATTPREELEFRLERAIIDTPSVKGWSRTGPREDAWDWFVDAESKIGYVRLSGFDDETTLELDRAIAQMREQGVRGLVFDLRFNPGGLLDQAVSIAQRFLPIDRQPIVLSRSAGGIEEVVGYTDARKATLASMPVVILVNEGSASASEIVSGAVSVFSERRDLDALVLGARSFGKGSVQNVWPLNAQQSAFLKITNAYYMLPDKAIIHRRPGATEWGVEPNLLINMLPNQVEDSILIRRNADIIPLAENGVDLNAQWKPTDPNRVLSESIDLQLQSAIVLVQARAHSKRVGPEKGADVHAAAEPSSPSSTRSTP